MPKQLNIKANFQLDTTAARQQLSGLQRELTSLTKGATMNLGVTEQITEAVRAAQLLKQTLNEATDFRTGAFDLSKFTMAMNQNMMSIQKFKDSLATLGPEGEKVFNNLATTIASAQVPLRRTSAGMQELLNTFSNTMRWQATSMAIHKVVGTISEAFNYAQNLDKSLNRIQIVTGHNADYMAKFAREANKAAQSLSASTLEYTNASLVYYQQGLADKEVSKRAETTLKLAKVTGESASKISQEMTAIWNNFSTGVDNLERYADVMTALGATTASSSSEIAKGLEKFAGISKTIGLSYDYAASALATVTAQTRQSADSVGTAFKTLFSRLESLNLGDTLDDGVTLNKYSEALMKVGVNVLDVNGQLKNMDTILDELGGHWKQLNQAQQVALAQTVGGVRNYTSLITLMDNWDKFQTNVVTAQMAEGTLQKQADIYADSWEAAQQRVKTASQGIYDTLISSDFFKGFNNALAGFLNTISKVGQTLGTPGSIAGLANLFLGLRKDQITTAIDNGIVNLLGQTSFGQNYFKSQQQASISLLKDEIMATGSISAGKRADILDNIYGAWDKFQPGRMTKQEAQAEQNLLMARTQQGLAAMNALVDLDQQKVNLNMSQNKAAQQMIGVLGIDKGTVASVFSGKANGIFGANSALGLASYLENTFSNSLMQLEGMDINSPAAKALTDYLQNTVKNVLTGPNSSEDFNQMAASSNQMIIKGKRAQGFDTNAFIQAMTGTQGKIDIPKALALIQGYATRETQFGQAALESLDKAFEDSHQGWDKASPEYAQDRKIYETLRTQMLTEQSTYGEKKLTADTNAINAAKGNVSPIPKTIPTEMQASFGEAAVATGQMITAMTMAANSIINFKSQVEDGTATATSLFSTMGSSVLAIGQMASVLGNPKVIQSLGMTVGQLGGIALGAAALGAGAFLGFKYVSANSLDNRQERANENQIQLSAIAKENQTKYEQFIPVIEQYQELLNKTLSLQKDTSEYTSSLLAANNQAREIIDTYGFTAGIDYDIDKNGNYVFSSKQIQAFNDKLLTRSQESNIYAQLGISANTQLKNSQIERSYAADRARIYAEHNLPGYDSVESYTDMYGGYVSTEAQQEQFNQNIEAIRRDELRKEYGLVQDLKTIETEEGNLSLANKADFQTALNSIIANTPDLSDAEKLAIMALGGSDEELEKYRDFILDELTNVHGDSLTHNELGGLLGEDQLRENYRTVFNYSAADDATRESMAAEIYGRLFYKQILKSIEEPASQLTAEYLNDFLDINTKSYNETQRIITDAQQSKDRDAYSTLIQKTLTDQVKSQENLANALLNNTAYYSQSNDNLFKIATELQQNLNLSTDNINNLANYVNSFGNNFGKDAGQAVYEALTQNGQWNQSFYDFLQSNVSTTNSITTLVDLQKQIDLKGNIDLKNSIDNLYKATVKGNDERGGLAKILFTSSEFQDTFSTLKDVYQSTGNITAENISNLAKKNETLNAYLALNARNTQGIADMASMLASGQISISDLTPAVAEFINNAAVGSAQQRGLQTLEDQDLSTSYSEIDKYYQNGGKAWYTAVQNDMLNDAPLQEFLKSIATEDDYAEIQRILYEGQWKDTAWMVSQIQSRTPELYNALQEWQGTGKKKGKGGGGLDTALYYYGQKGIFSDAGLTIDENGKINFSEDFDKIFAQATSGQKQTEANVYDFLVNYLTSEARGDQRFSRGNAQTLAAQMVGKISATSLGTTFALEGLKAGEEALLKELSEGENKNISGDALRTIGEEYKDRIAFMKRLENGSIVEASEDEIKSGNYTKVTPEEYIQYLADQIKANGGAIVDLAGWQGSTDIGTIGNVLAKNSYGTIATTGTTDIEKGTSAIINAAIASGVDLIQDETGAFLDFTKLQDFYTNILNLPIETFNQHLPELMDGLTAAYEGQGGIGYSYTDIFGHTTTVNSRDFIKNGSFDQSGYSQAIKNAEINQQLDDFASQQIMQDAWEQFTSENNKGPNAKSFYEIYQDLLSSYQEDNNRPTTHELSKAESTAEQKAQQEKINILKKTYGLSEEEILQRTNDGETFDDLLAEQRAKAADKRVQKAQQQQEALDKEAQTFVSETPEIGPKGLDRIIGSLKDYGFKGIDTILTEEAQRNNLVNALASAYNISPEEASNQLLQMEAAQAQAKMEPVKESDIDAFAGREDQIIVPGLFEGLFNETVNSIQDFAEGVKHVSEIPTNFQKGLDSLLNLEEENELNPETEKAIEVLGQQQAALAISSTEIPGVNIPSKNAQIEAYLANILKEEKLISDNTESTAENTGEALEVAETNVEKAQQDQKAGKQPSTTPEKSDKKYDMPTTQQQQGGSSWDGYGVSPDSDKIKAPSISKTLSKFADLFNKPLQGELKVDLVTDPKASKRIQLSNNGGSGRANGQNNNLLTFASGKEGQIAVTGELGPELRIKSDGTADLLGKKGREYAWVNPDDKIYTATQTASILGSNNIPALEGLAKGIRNYIPGFTLGKKSTDESSSGGSGNGGGGGSDDEKDPRYDPNTLKIRDILERYYTILQQLNVIAHAVEHISKVVDRGWGQERIKAIQEQTALYQKQYDAQVKYVQEIRSYTKTDKEALTTMVREFVEGYNEGKGETDRLTWNGAEFDENGVLTNYKDFVEKLVEQYNEKAEENAGDKEAQYKFQEQLKDIQFYTESLNLLMTEEEKLYDLRNQILDNQVKEVSYRIEYENEIDNNDLRLINYELGKVKDNAYEAAEAIALIGQTSDFTEKSLARYEQGIWDILKVYSNPETVESMQKAFFDDPQAFFTEWSKYENNFNFQDITTEHAQLLEQYMDTMISDLQKLQSNFEQTIDFMGDNIKEFSKTLDKEVGEFDYFSDLQKNLKSILDLTNRRQTNVDSTFLAGLNADVLDNAMNKMKGTKRTLETMTQSLKEANAVYQQFLDMQAADTGEDAEYTAWLQRMVDRTKKNLDTVNEQYEKANKDWLQSWEDALSKIEESYKQAVEEAGKAFEESFSPFFTTLDLLQAQFDREKKLQDLFVDDYQRIHDLSKLNRDIEQSMLDTDNLRSKARLRDLQKEINQLQADGTELSEYDLDILDKKYKLELARQALEDAKDAKSLVRLSRDNNGNWGYVYTSNEDEVAKAEQDYEDAIREMEEANENYIANIQDQIVQVQQEAQQAIQNLQPQDFETYEDYLAAVQNIQNSMMTTLNYLRAQLNGAFTNQDYLNPFIVARYGENNHNLTNDFGDLILSKLLDTNTMDQVVNDAIDRFNKLSEASEQAFTEYSERQREVWQTAGHDIADAAGAIGEMFKEIADQSNEQVEIVEQVADRIDEAYAKTTDAIKDQITNLQELTNHYETFLEKVTEFLKLSGEYVPGAKKDFYETIDSWEEIAEIEKELAEKKDLFVTDLDASGNQRGYHLYEGNAETNAQIAAWKDSLMRGEAIEIGDVVDTRDELNQINSYLDAHGEAYVNINGELIHLVKGTEETNRLLAEWLAYIEQLEKPKPVNNNSSSGIGQWYNNDGTPIVWGGYWYDQGVKAGAYSAKTSSNIPRGQTAVRNLTGGYTGRWQSALSGMYTGEWPMGSVESNGRWALLHQKELVLNAHDTENFLDAMEIVRQLDNLTNWMANGLGSLFVPNVTTEREQLEQNVHIDASFPNAQDHREIEMAFDNIVNLASQYANRK